MTTTNEAPKAKKAKGAGKGAKKTETAWTLTQTAIAYLESLKAARKSEATISAYASDLDIATAVLGAETSVRAITLDDVARFNQAPQVLTTKSGRPKAQPTVERSRRVLRLALTFAEREGVIEHAPFEAKRRESKPVEETPTPAPAKPKRAKKSATTATEPEVGSEEWKHAQRALPLHQREAIGNDDERNKPAAAEDDPAQIVYASTGEEVRA